MDFLNYLLSSYGGFGTNGGFGTSALGGTGIGPNALGGFPGGGVHPLDILAQGLRSGGLDLHNWLASLDPRTTANPFPVGNPMPALTASPAGSTLLYPGGTPGTAAIPSPSTYPSGSQMLTPGGTPETSTDVGGQPAAPSYWNMGPQTGPSGGGAGGGPTGILSIPQQWLAAHQGLGPGADQATAAALQRAAAYHAMLLGS